MSDVQVIGLPQSNYVWAVRIALAEKGVVHENIPAPPHSPEAVAVHPMGKIPVLRHGAVALGESRAIIDYIDATFDGSPLVPVERDAALRSDTWTSIIATSIEPLLVRQYLFAYMIPGTVDGQPDRAVVEALLPKVEATLDVVETALGVGRGWRRPVRARRCLSRSDPLLRAQHARRWADDRRQTSSQRLSRSLARTAKRPNDDAASAAGLTMTAPRKVALVTGASSGIGHYQLRRDQDASES